MIEKDNQLEQLKKNLETNDFEVLTVKDGKAGFELARKTEPDLILSSLQLDKLDGIDLCFMIRQNVKLSSTPYILISDNINPEERINAFRSGIDAIVETTISTRELITRIDTLIRRYEQLTDQEIKTNQSLIGKLNDFRLIEILQMLNLNQKTGMLKVYHQSYEGQIAFHKGKITWACLNSTDGEKAIQKMVFWEEGFFIYEKDRIHSDINIEKPTMKLILDCCQLLDESKNPSLSFEMENNFS